MDVIEQPLSEPGRSTAEAAPLYPNRILLHCPEITLKGKNYGDFQTALCTNVRHRLRRLGLSWPVKAAYGRLYADLPPEDTAAVENALAALAETAGVESLAAAVWLRPARTRQNTPDPDRALIEDTLVGLARQHYRPNATFAVHINRVDKQTPITSQDMERWLGAAIRARTEWDKVNLTRPDRLFQIDIYPDGMYLYADKRKGPGGLPVDSGGRVLALLSGGIDSPVAACLLAKRGCTVDLFHMSATHMPAAAIDRSVVGRLARRLSDYTLRSRLYVLPYTHFDLALPGERTGYELVLFRRFMARTAETLAERIGAGALVSGDSLGQVASQTLDNLASQSRAVEMPILRPLIGFNKQEIIALARRLGTYDISIEAYKDCCALLSHHPATRSRHGALTRLENRLLPEPDYGRLIEATLADLIALDYDCGERVDSERAVDEKPVL